MAGRFSLDAVFRGFDMMSGVTRKISRSLDKISKAAAGSMAKINSASNAAADSLKKVAFAAGVVGVAAGAAAAHLGAAGADFEQAIVNVGAVSLMTREEIADLEKKALELGATTKFTATEAANAMEIMGRAGFTNAEVLASVDAVLAASAASGMEMAEVASHVSNTLKGMGLEAKEAARVADVLALAEARTNSSIGSLGESMKNLAPVARQMGVSLEESVAAVALLQDVGIDASEAGTATATMLTKLTKPADDVAAKMKQLGIAFKDAKGNALSFPQILGQFEKAAGKAGGNMEVIAFFADLVGLRGQKAALNLKEMFASGKFSDLVKELQGAEGTAKKMADLRMDSLRGDLTLLESAVDGVKVALYDTQNGPLRGVVKSMTEWVGENEKLIKSGFVEYLDKGKPIVDTFVAGVKNGFNDMKPVLAFVSKVFLGLFGLESDKPIVLAGLWGERIARLAVALALFAVATKVAAGVMLLYAGVTKAAAIATATWTFLTKAAHAALLIFNLTRKFGIGYLIATIFQTNLETGAKVANTAATVTNTAATRAGAVAKAFFTTMSKGQTAALITSTGVLKGAAAGMAAFGLATLAVVGSFMLLMSQLEDFKKANDGIGFGELMGDWMTNDKSLFDTLDDKMDAKARARRQEADKLAAGGVAAAGMTPNMSGHMGDSAAELAKMMEQTNQLLASSQIGGMGVTEFGPPLPPGSTAGVSLDGGSLAALENLQVTGPAEIVLPDRLARDDKMTITVRAEGGAEAEVTEAPKTKGTTISMAPSGTP